VDVLRWDELDLSVEARVLEITPPPASANIEELDEEAAEEERNSAAEPNPDSEIRASVPGEQALADEAADNTADKTIDKTADGSPAL
jgi:exoribonuclease-2